MAEIECSVRQIMVSTEQRSTELCLYGFLRALSADSGHIDGREAVRIHYLCAPDLVEPPMRVLVHIDEFSQRFTHRTDGFVGTVESWGRHGRVWYVWVEYPVIRE